MTVLQQQCLLTYLGYLGAGKQDGIYGEVTAFAVEQFQRDYGITPDRVCGPITEKMLLGAAAGTVTKKVSSQTQTNPEKQQTGTWWDEIEYFRQDEGNIHCPCFRCAGKQIDPEQRLMLEADRIRKIAGKPMIPSSVRRCQEHNDELQGSAPNSYHIRGLAMDFDIPALDDSQIRAILEAEKAAGRIRYWYQMTNGWFHFDVN